jgi:hypothetical protein
MRTIDSSTWALAVAYVFSGSLLPFGGIWQGEQCMVIRGSTLAAYVILGALTCAFLVDEQNWKRAPVTRNKITIVFFISLYILVGKIINL